MTLSSSQGRTSNWTRHRVSSQVVSPSLVKMECEACERHDGLDHPNMNHEMKFVVGERLEIEKLLEDKMLDNDNGNRAPCGRMRISHVIGNLAMSRCRWCGENLINCVGIEMDKRSPTHVDTKDMSKVCSLSMVDPSTLGVLFA